MRLEDQRTDSPDVHQSPFVRKTRERTTWPPGLPALTTDNAIPEPEIKSRSLLRVCVRSPYNGIVPMPAPRTSPVVLSMGGIASIFRRPFLEKVAGGMHVPTILELADHCRG